MEHKNINKFDIMEKITPLVENTTMRYGFFPIEIDFSKESGRWFLRIFIYSTEKPVTLDDCENISRSLSDFLDELIPIKYNLEISSPGLDRKIKSDKEYLVFKGKLVNVKLKKSLDEKTQEKHIVGRIVDFDVSEGLVLKIGDETVTIPKDNIQKSQLEIE